MFPVTAVDEPRRVRLGARDIAGPRLKRGRRRRRIAFLVDEEGLAVHAPWRASDQAIDLALRSGGRLDPPEARRMVRASARPAPRVDRWRTARLSRPAPGACSGGLEHDRIAALTQITGRWRTARARAEDRPAGGGPRARREVVPAPRRARTSGTRRPLRGQAGRRASPAHLSCRMLTVTGAAATRSARCGSTGG